MSCCYGSVSQVNYPKPLLKVQNLKLKIIKVHINTQQHNFSIASTFLYIFSTF